MAERLDRARQAAREQLMVETVTDDGATTGACTVAQAHRGALLHRAFSVVLHDGAGRLLLQQRAASKVRFPGHWANACCGHPAPGQRPADAAAARILAELGATVDGLEEAGIVRYRAADPHSGHVEHEFDHVLIGRLDPRRALAPVPDEVSALAWFTVADVDALIAGDPERSDCHRTAPWLRHVHACARPRLLATDPVPVP